METQTKDVKRVAPGQLDPKFGDFGQIRPHNRSGLVTAIALSAEGVLTYVVWEGIGFNVYRTDPDGKPDQAFNGGSTGEWQFVPSKDARPARLLLQEDGKVLVIGDSRNGGSAGPAALRRFNANGTPDLVFGGFVIPVHSDSSAASIDACLQVDGKILVVFNYSGSTSKASVLVRLHSNGELDTSFAGTGFVEVESEDAIIVLTSIVIQDGKIIVGGATRSNQLVLARYDIEGKIDTDFGVDGFAFFAAADGSSLSMSQLIAQTDGTLVCAGTRIVGGIEAMGMVMRFTADGHPDVLFNGGLPVLTEAGAEASWDSLAQQPDGKIVVAGTSMRFTNMIVGRLLPDGVHDASLDGIGWVSIGSAGGAAKDVKIQSSARIIVGGDTFNDNGTRVPVVFGLQT